MSCFHVCEENKGVDVAPVALCQADFLSGILLLKGCWPQRNPESSAFILYLALWFTYRKVNLGKKWVTVQILMVSVVILLAWSTLRLINCVCRLLESWSSDTLMTSVKNLLSSSFLVSIKHLWKPKSILLRHTRFCMQRTQQWSRRHYGYCVRIPRDNILIYGCIMRASL